MTRHAIALCVVACSVALGLAGCSSNKSTTSSKSNQIGACKKQPSLSSCRTAQKGDLHLAYQWLRIAQSRLCREILAERIAKENKLVMTDTIVSSLKRKYTTRSQNYNYTAKDAPILEGLPARADSLKTVIAKC